MNRHAKRRARAAERKAIARWLREQIEREFNDADCPSAGLVNIRDAVLRCALAIEGGLHRRAS